MATNNAAWLKAEKVIPLEIGIKPFGVPSENQILVKNHAVAINPSDVKMQYDALFPLVYPIILGSDAAGEVVEVGSGVTRFKKGDRVAGCAAGFFTKSNDAKTFQEYTILETNMTTPIPDSVPYEQAVVFPLAASTAAAALFGPGNLNLKVPTVPARQAAGDVVLVWGGASSVGCSAIQLAVAAGYEVLSTASPKNFDLLKRLGASHVFDYSSASVVSDLLEVSRGKVVVGVFDTIGGVTAWNPSFEFVQLSNGRQHVATVLPVISTPPEGVTMKQVQAMSIVPNHVGNAIFKDFLPAALESGAFAPAPSAFIYGQGLESLQGAIDLLRSAGNSARKIVVTL